MTIKEITKYLNIPTSTFHEWNKIGHKKYELTLLLLALPLEQVKTILEKTKQELNIITLKNSEAKNTFKTIQFVVKSKQYATIAKSALDKNQRTGSWLAIGY